MPTDANRPCPELLTEAETTELWEFANKIARGVRAAWDERHTRIEGQGRDKVVTILRDRLAQAQIEAEQAMLEIAAQQVDLSVEDCDEGSNEAQLLQATAHCIRKLSPGTALELAKVRAAEEEAKWWHDKVGDDYAERIGDACCDRIAELTKRKAELERGQETSK